MAFFEHALPARRPERAGSAGDQRQIEIDSGLSRQIGVLRVICIFFVLSVHVNPALDWGNIQGAWSIIGFFWKDVLGRASVATLSLISGYLLVGSLSKKCLWMFITNRFRSLYVPMVFWNVVFMLSVLMAGIIIDVRSSSFHDFLESGLLELALERSLNIYGSPAVQALAFLRDLMVCSIILVIALRIFGRYLVCFLPLIGDCATRCGRAGCVQAKHSVLRVGERRSAAKRNPSGSAEKLALTDPCRPWVGGSGAFQHATRALVSQRLLCRSRGIAPESHAHPLPDRPERSIDPLISREMALGMGSRMCS